MMTGNVTAGPPNIVTYPPAAYCCCPLWILLQLLIEDDFVRVGGRMGEPDSAVMLDILQLAEANAEAARQPMSMLFCLEAYDVVLPRFGIDKSKDLVYYQALLALNLNGVYSHTSIKSGLENLNPQSLIKHSIGEPNDQSVCQDGFYSGECEPFNAPYKSQDSFPTGASYSLGKIGSVDRFLKKCHSMIVSDAFRSWKSLTIAGKRSKVYIRAWNAKASEHYELSSFRSAICCWKTFARRRNALQALRLQAENHFTRAVRLKLITAIRDQIVQHKRIQNAMKSVRVSSVRCRQRSAIRRWDVKAKQSKSVFLMKRCLLEALKRRNIIQLWLMCMKCKVEDRSARLKLAIRFWHHRTKLSRPNPLHKPDFFIQALLFWIRTSYSCDLEPIFNSRTPNEALQNLQLVCAIKWRINSHANCKTRLRLLHQPITTLALRVWRFTSQQNRRHRRIVLITCVQQFRRLVALEYELVQRRHHLKQYWTFLSWYRGWVFESSFRTLNPRFIKIVQKSRLCRFFTIWRSFLVSRNIYSRILSARIWWIWRQELRNNVCSKAWHVIADNYYTSHTGRRIFSEWRVAVFRNQKLTQLAFQVDELHSQTVLLRAFRQWSKMLTLRKEFASQNALAVSWCYARRKQAALRSWQMSQINSLRSKQLIESAERHLKVSQCRRFISACLSYRVLNVNRKNLIAKSCQLFHQLRSRDAIKKLKWHAQRRKLLRAQASQIRSNCLRRIWKFWRCVYLGNQVHQQVLRLRVSFLFKRFRKAILLQQRSEARIIADFDKRRRNSTLSRSMYEWARTLSISVLMKSLESRVVENNNYQILAEHWRAWTSCYRIRLRMEIDCRRLQSLHENKLRQVYLVRWSQALKHLLFNQMCIDKTRKIYRGHLLGRTVHVWRAALAAHLALDVNATLFARACCRRRQVRVFRSWNNAVRTQLMRSQYADLFYRRRLFRNFDRWLVQLRRRQHRCTQLKRMLQIVQSNCLRVHLRLFFQRCALQRLRCDALQRCFRTRERASLHRSFRSWCKHRNYLPILQRIRQLQYGHLLRRSWTIWLGEFRQQFAKNRAIQVSVFRSWSKWSLERSSKRRVKQAIALRYHSALVLCHWRLWRHVASSFSVAKRFAAKNLLKRYFLTWQWHFQYNQHLAQLSHEADQFYQRLLQRKSFREIAAICDYLRQANVLLAKRNSVLLRSALGRWFRVLQVGRAASKCRLKAQQSRFLVWLRFTKLQSLMKTMWRRLEPQIIKNAFVTWKHASQLEHLLQAKCSEFRNYRVQLLTKIAIQQLLLNGQQKRKLKNLLKICQQSNQQFRLQRAVACLVYNRECRASYRSSCEKLNSRFVKRIRFQRWKKFVHKLKTVRLNGEIACRIRVKTGFRQWLTKLQRRSKLSRCRQSLIVSKRFCAWVRHTRKMASLRMQRISTRNRVIQLRQRFCFQSWRTKFAFQISLQQMTALAAQQDRHRLLSQVWIIWAGLHSVYDNERRLEQRVFLARDHLRLVRGYVALLGHYRQQCRLRQFQHDVATAHNRSAQRQALQAWSLAYADRFRVRQMTRVSSRMRRILLWRRVIRAIDFSRLVRRLQHVCTRNVLRRLLMRWKQSLSLKENFRHLVRTRTVCKERSLFQKWRQFTRISRSKRDSFAYLCRQLAIKCPFVHSRLHSSSDNLQIVFTSWRFWARSRNLKKNASRRTIFEWSQRRISSVQAKVLDWWHRKLISQQYRKRFANLHQSQAIRLWVRRSQHRRSMRQHTRIALLFHRRYRLIIFFSKWQHRILTIWRLKSVAGLLAARHREYVLRQYTSSWLERFLAKCQEREAYLRALEHYHLHVQRKAFVALRARAQHTALHAQRAAALINQYRLQMEEACFRAWHDYACKRRYRHQTRRQREMALLNKQNVFLYWRMYVRRIRSTRRLLKKKKGNASPSRSQRDNHLRLDRSGSHSFINVAR